MAETAEGVTSTDGRSNERPAELETNGISHDAMAAKPEPRNKRNWRGGDFLLKGESVGGEEGKRNREEDEMNMKRTMRRRRKKREDEEEDEEPIVE